MKNIHVLPTDKPSRLQLNVNTKTLILFNNIQSNNESAHLTTQNIYITSDEKIKKGNWCLNPKTNKVIKVGHHGHYGYSSKKIILTTDEDLIKDGVQAIDDEFLEWFVKNPSCEFVGVKKYHGVKTAIAEISAVSGNDDYNWKGRGDLRDYKIIIPKEEPKQDEIMERFIANAKQQETTLEEVVNNFKKTDVYINEIKQEQERRYSEEEVEILLETLSKVLVYQGNDYRLPHYFEYEIKQIIEQFKKK